VDKTARKKSDELLIDKLNKDDDWNVSENGHATTPAGDISHHFSDAEMSQPKKAPGMSPSGEPSRDNYELGLDVEEGDSLTGWYCEVHCAENAKLFCGK